MSKLASFVAGFGGGYLKARDKEYDRERQAKLDERQAKLDAQQEEQFGWARNAAAAAQRERDNREALDKAVSEGMDAGKVKEAAQVSYTGADGAQKTAAQPDLQTAQFAADQQRLEENQSLAPPAAPSAPKAEQTASVRTLDGARRLFTGLTAASDAKKFADENPVTPYAKYMAMSERLAGMAGGQEKADAYLKRAKEAEKEGAFRALTMLDAGDPDGALKAWNSTGAKRLDAGQKFVTTTDKAGSKTHQVVDADNNVVVPNVEQAMLRYLSGIEGATRRAEARDKAAADLAAKRFEIENDPSKRFLQVRPGTAVYDTVGADAGKLVVDNTKGYVEDVNGNLVRPGKYVNTGGAGGAGGAGGEGAGGKGKPDDPIGATTKAIMDAVKESAESKTLNADQLIGVQATARELVFNATRSGRQLDPYVAGKVALTAVLKPESVKPSYDSTTGAFENTVAYNGNTYAVGRLDQTAMSEGQLKGVAQSFVGKLPAATRAEYVKAAAGDPQVMAKINSDIAASHGKEWADRFAAVNGRRPTQQEIGASVARTQAIVQQNISLVGISGAVEQDKKQRETESRRATEADAKKAIGTPESIMALPPGEAQRIYGQYGQYTNAFQREALQRKMQRDRMEMPARGLTKP